MHSVQLVLVDLVESLVFFLAGTLASVSLTVTQFTLLYNPILNIGNGWVTFEDSLQFTLWNVLMRLLCL